MEEREFLNLKTGEIERVSARSGPPEPLSVDLLERLLREVARRRAVSAFMGSAKQLLAEFERVGSFSERPKTTAKEIGETLRSKLDEVRERGFEVEIRADGNRKTNLYWIRILATETESRS